MSFDFAMSAMPIRPPDSQLRQIAPLSVLLALDGGPGGDAAARVALALAEQRMSLVRVLQVIDTRPVPIPPPLDVALAVADAAYGQSLQSEHETLVSSRLEKTLAREVSWPVGIRLGQPSHVILHEALSHDATLIAMGLRHHRAIDRAMRNDTVHEILRATTLPVIAVTEQLQSLPTHVVVGMDFSRASIDAARAALALLADGGRLTLAYVASAFAFGIEEGEQLVQQLGVAAAFNQVREALAPPRGATIDTVVLDGTLTRNIATTLRGYVDDVQADLVALGARRHGRLERWVVGSVTSDFAREGLHSLLAVPALDEQLPAPS